MARSKLDSTVAGLLAAGLAASALACTSTAEPPSRGGAGNSGAGTLAGSSGSAGSAGTSAAGSSSVGGGSGSGNGGSGNAGSGGALAGSGGQSGSDAGGSAGSSGAGGGTAAACPAECVSDPASRESCAPCFSFFVTSVEAMQRLSNDPNGFGGDLRFGQNDGLSGADEICRQIAEDSLPGAGSKTWRAFLSVVNGPGGGPVHAKDRIGNGPWYDRVGRLVAANLANLLQERPEGADPAIRDDLPNEHGIPNHVACEGCADPLQCCDNHDVLTGTGPDGMLYTGGGGGFFNCEGAECTCDDWTTTVGSAGRPWVGHSWPRQGSGVNWMSALAEAGCAPGVFLNEMGGPMGDTVGGGGGYGGIYCFAVAP